MNRQSLSKESLHLENQTVENNEKEMSEVQQPENILAHLSIDNVVFGIQDGRLMLLTAKYNDVNSAGRWRLLGGKIGVDEPAIDAAKRTMKSATGVDEVYFEQLKAYGEVGRFPGGRVITIAYYALVRPEWYHLIPGGEAYHLEWKDAREIPKLIYDHNKIVEDVLEHLKYKVRHEPIGFNLLPEKFTLHMLQEVYEAILDTKLDKPNFRRKILKMNLLIPCNEKQRGVTHRAANLYRFDMEVYEKLIEKGFAFEF